jgi:hypothetical protein
MGASSLGRVGMGHETAVSIKWVGYLEYFGRAAHVRCTPDSCQFAAARNVGSRAPAAEISADGNERALGGIPLMTQPTARFYAGCVPPSHTAAIAQCFVETC